ncbi:PD-(D/E)XK nuclease family protein [Brachyspira aalborgi]|uniref:PD-(D/E)XK nuclease family protein n=1 Tax=Brachyspira aalborgi TaxID=29522 RepID=A0A5C8FIG2_9SPIR|nr:PD-(D/E)XK nuclease family protein [Brachyspira aalborgi]TXJ49062.1 hypothetical protein EPJ84_08730 [Brachyspira aalborgi]
MAKSLTKEKEKLCRVEEIFQSLIEVKEEVSKKIEKLPPQFNLLENIRNKNSNNSLQRFETYNSDLLHYLLNIKRENLNFTKLFLEYLKNEKKLKFDFDLNKINYKNIKVDKEYYTTVKIEEEGIEKNGRIDILIHCNINNKETKKSFAIIIENKINADDQDKQLERYYKYISKTKGYGNNVYVIYLTPIIKSPKEYSLSEKYIKEIGEKFKNVTHGDIGRWLENILKNKEYNFLHKNDFRLLKSALIQMVDNEKSISGENEENNVEEKEIKKLLDEKLIKELKSKGELTESELDKYFEMFDKAKSLLVKEKITIIIKKCLKFTKEVNKYLNKNIKYELTSDKDIINNINMVNENSTNNIDNIYFKFKVNKIEINICDWHEWNKKNNNSYIYSEYCIAIYKGNKSTKNKLKKLEDNIKNIFYNWQFYDQDDYNRYAYLVNNVEEVSPKETAEAINKLYELLKKEIK